MTVGCKTPCTDTVDICGFEEFKAAPPTTAAQARVVISGYTDPIVRAAAVGFWIGLHPQTPAGEATALCALLEPQEQRGCLRRVTSPHLRGCLRIRDERFAAKYSVGWRAISSLWSFLLSDHTPRKVAGSALSTRRSARPPSADGRAQTLLVQRTSASAVCATALGRARYFV